VEQISRAENFLLSCVQMLDAEGAAIRFECDRLRRSDEVLLRRILPLKLSKYCG
jgi:hypothetical protein